MQIVKTGYVPQKIKAKDIAYKDGFNLFVDAFGKKLSKKALIDNLYITEEDAKAMLPLRKCTITIDVED